MPGGRAAARIGPYASVIPLQVISWHPLKSRTYGFPNWPIDLTIASECTQFAYSEKLIPHGHYIHPVVSRTQHYQIATGQQKLNSSRGDGSLVHHQSSRTDVETENPKASHPEQNEAVLKLENRLLELTKNIEAKEASLKTAEAVTLKNIEEAANKASGAAVDRVVKIVELTKNMILLLIAGGTILGIGGYFQIQRHVKSFAEAKVKSWLDVTDESSPLHGSITKLTTRVATTALIMERARSGTRTAIGELKITSVWIDKILKEIIDPLTSESDFSDLVLALATESSLIGGGEHRGRVIEVIKNALIDPAFPAQKKAVILRTFGFDPSLRDAALKVFLNDKNIVSQAAAFRYIRKTTSERTVLPLAKPILKLDVEKDDLTNATLQLEAASVLAEIDFRSADLHAFLQKKNRGEDVVLENAVIALAALARLAPARFTYDPVPEQEKAQRLSFAIPFLQKAVESGIRVVWTSTSASTPAIALSQATRNGAKLHYIPDPRTILAQGLANELLSKLGRDTKGLDKLTHAFTSTDTFDRATSLPYKIAIVLGEKDQLMTTTREVINKTRTNGQIYLERDVENNSSTLIRWQDIDGLYKAGYLLSANLQTASISIIPASPSKAHILENYTFNSVDM
ncbi:hypothetical protein [Pseudoduganella umbonata]|uniref:Uncharacterized protein n=1 Tax=Pseudoduganella umbonata TaxID=864828 RepID=A0A4P8HU39_9BURK|nr:hypothetical protein [Pseudoduganella umbonata]MBB3220582.1 hypothetical protein [Pseudoduganella umbonata]QCP11915.1 hypothetical protein FCL38_16950 [Pseudoduganella umbonata]